MEHYRYLELPVRTLLAPVFQIWKRGTVAILAPVQYFRSGNAVFITAVYVDVGGLDFRSGNAVAVPARYGRLLLCWSSSIYGS